MWYGGIVQRVMRNTANICRNIHDFANPQNAIVAYPTYADRCIQQVMNDQAVIESLQLAAHAENILQHPNVDTVPAVLLAIRALKRAYSTEADAVLAEALRSGYAKLGLIGPP